MCINNGIIKTHLWNNYLTTVWPLPLNVIFFRLFFFCTYFFSISSLFHLFFLCFFFLFLNYGIVSVWLSIDVIKMNIAIWLETNDDCAAEFSQCSKYIHTFFCSLALSRSLSFSLHLKLLLQFVEIDVF